MAAETLAVSATSHLVPLKFSATAVSPELPAAVVPLLPTAQQSRGDAQATDCSPPPRKLAPVTTFQRPPDILRRSVPPEPAEPTAKHMAALRQLTSVRKRAGPFATPGAPIAAQTRPFQCSISGAVDPRKPPLPPTA